MMKIIIIIIFIIRLLSPCCRELRCWSGAAARISDIAGSNQHGWTALNSASAAGNTTPSFNRSLANTTEAGVRAESLKQVGRADGNLNYFLTYKYTQNGQIHLL